MSGVNAEVEAQRVRMAESLYEILTRHDADRSECTEHEGPCCPVPKCSHEVQSRQHHHADVLSALVVSMSGAG